MPRTNAPPKTEFVTFRLPEKPMRRLAAKADHLGLGVNETARNLVVEMLAADDEQPDGAPVINVAKDSSLIAALGQKE